MYTINSSSELYLSLLVHYNYTTLDTTVEIYRYIHNEIASTK